MRRILLVIATCLAAAMFVSAQKSSTRPETPTRSVAGTASADARTLPVRKVVLYKNGVGYFEHFGRVHGDEDLSIEFTTAQLNDVLKSLTAVDLGGGRITGVRYNSIAPLEQRLRTLQIPLGTDVTSSGFLAALRGTRVEVRSGATSATGKILSVETIQKDTNKGGTVEVSRLSILGDGGDLHSFELGPGTTVRVLDGAVRQDVNRYLNLVASSRSKDVRRMTISAAGSGDRDLLVSYISEVPVWKSTYRIVIPTEKDKPFIQGWAIVDNTVGEDWNDVQLSLVAGAPQSFIQNISQPYYTRRPVIPLPQSVLLMPQEHEAAMSEEAETALAPPPPPPPGIGPGAGGGVGGGVMGGIIGGIVSRNKAISGPGLGGTVTDPTGAVIPNAEVIVRTASGIVQTTRSDSSGRFRFYGLPSGTASLTISSPGFSTLRYSNIYVSGGSSSDLNAILRVGSTNQAVEVSAEAAKVDRFDSFAVTNALRDQESGAEGGKLGELFEYKLKQKVTVLKNQSALVPIVQSPVEAQKVTLVTADQNGNVFGTPLRALWVRNTTGQTLDGGTFEIIEDGSFAGEGLIDVLHSDERRLLSYAADTAIHVSTTQDSENTAATHVSILKGILRVTREQRSTRTYTIRNADAQSREVVVEHPIRAGWKLNDGIVPEESSASHYRFRLKIDAAKTEKLVIKEHRPDVSALYLTSLTDDQISLFVQQKTIGPKVEATLRSVLAKKNEITAVDRDINTRQQEIESISRDQARVRENMKALKGSAEEKALVQRYTREMESQEDRLATLRKEIGGLNTRRAQLQSELDQMVQDISLDEDI